MSRLFFSLFGGNRILLERSDLGKLLLQGMGGEWPSRDVGNEPFRGSLKGNQKG